jgi:hypothetical protein
MDSSDVGHGSRERSKDIVWVFFLQFYAIETGQILGSTDLTPALASQRFIACQMQFIIIIF